MFSIFTRNNFTQIIPKPRNILLVEVNGCHGEVIGAYVQYFRELNFNIYILTTDTIHKENPFVRQNVENTFYCKFRSFKKLLCEKQLNKYDHIVVMSSVCYTGGENAVTDLFPDLKKHKSVFYVHHDLAYINRFYKNIDPKRNIMLGRFPNTVYINPHLFGAYTVPEKTTETIFVCVGGINPKRKNHILLMNTIQKLHDKNYKFMVYVIGSGSLKHIPKSIKSHIKVLGHLGYPEMYDYVEKSHYFVPLLDDTNPEHERYITVQVTGSAQLIYGFAKVPVIHEKFADFYSFNNDNAIMYKTLYQGMEQAILQNNDDYKNKVLNLKQTAQQIKQESMSNLKDILDV